MSTRMADFTIKSDGVDVEQIMERIRERIREKRGVDYTEGEVKTLASVKLDKFLDPGAIRSDLLEYYRKNRPAVQPPIGEHQLNLPLPPATFAFEADTIYASSRGLAGRFIALARKLLNPVLKLFFNPNPLIHVLHMQADINGYLLALEGPLTKLNEVIDEIRLRVNDRERIRGDLDLLHYEVLNNLVVETTRMNIEVRNMKMRLESLAGRLDFDERRARALEGVVQYKTGASVPKDAVTAPATATAPKPQAEGAVGEESPGRGRRRRRRGRRRPGTSEGGPEAGAGEASGATGAADAVAPTARAAADTAESHES